MRLMKYLIIFNKTKQIILALLIVHSCKMSLVMSKNSTQNNKQKLYGVKVFQKFDGIALTVCMMAKGAICIFGKILEPQKANIPKIFIYSEYQKSIPGRVAPSCIAYNLYASTHTEHMHREYHSLYFPFHIGQHLRPNLYKLC